jgi:hypothetical protein
MLNEVRSDVVLRTDKLIHRNPVNLFIMDYVAFSQVRDNLLFDFFRFD